MQLSAAYARQGLIRHSLRQTLPVFEDVYRKTGVQQAILRTCSRKKVIFLSHSLVIDNKRGARNEQNANRRSCGRDSFTRFKRSGTNRTGRLSATASAHDEVVNKNWPPS